MKTILTVVSLAASLNAFSAPILSVPAFKGRLPLQGNARGEITISKVIAIGAIEYNTCFACNEKYEVKGEELRFHKSDKNLSFELDRDFLVQSAPRNEFLNCSLSLRIEGESESGQSIVATYGLLKSRDPKDCRSRQKVNESLQKSLMSQLKLIWSQDYLR